MDRNLIFWPVLVQMLLTMVMFIKMSVSKKRVRRAGTVDLTRSPLHYDAWPDDVLKISNNIRNQFELPVLFYALVLMLWMLSAVDLMAVAVAWIFALSRLVHAYIHTGPNVVKYRLPMFIVGFVAVICLFALVVRALVTGAAA